MKEELQDRIQRLLDEGGGLALDEELEVALAEAGDEARAEADGLAQVDAALRAFPEVELDDEAAEAIATRIEQRLDEDLARIPDPAAPPILGDEDGQPPRRSSSPPAKKDQPGAYSLANLTSLSVKDAPPVEPDAPLRRPPQKPVVRESQVEMMEADDVGLEDLPDSAPPPAQPPPAPKEPLAMSDERASIPSVPPMDLKGAEESGELPPPPVDLEEVRARRKRLFYLGSGLAAAAAVLVVAVTGLSTMGSDEGPVAMAPGAVSSAEMEEAAADPAYVPSEPAPASTGQQYLGAMARSADEADRSVASESAAVVEAPAEEEPMAEVEEAEEPEQAEASAARPEREARARMRRRHGAAAMRAAAPASRRRSRSGSMASPSRGQVLRAMRAIQPRVEACAGSRHGTVQVNVVVSGRSGRVRNAVVQGEFAGTREGSCVARAVRRARFPEFSRDSFSFTYPFRL